MKTQIFLYGAVLFTLTSVAQARGRSTPTRAQPDIVVTKAEVAPSGAEADGSNSSLDLKVDLQVTTQVGDDVTLTAITACKVNGQVKTDTTDIPGDLSGLEVGETKSVEASLFSSARLEAAPSQCQITFRENKEFTRPRDVATVCYASGKVTGGACR